MQVTPLLMLPDCCCFLAPPPKKWMCKRSIFLIICQIKNGYKHPLSPKDDNSGVTAVFSSEGRLRGHIDMFGFMYKYRDWGSWRQAKPQKLAVSSLQIVRRMKWNIMVRRRDPCFRAEFKTWKCWMSIGTIALPITWINLLVVCNWTLISLSRIIF